MSEMRLGLRENRTGYSPGEAIVGAADWALDKPPRRAEVRLSWFTQGKGSTDSQIVHAVDFPEPKAEDLRQFSFPAPPAPYSFSGKLISLLWAVELVLQPGERTERIEIVIAPGGLEVVLPALGKEDPKQRAALAGLAPLR